MRQGSGLSVWAGVSLALLLSGCDFKPLKPTASEKVVGNDTRISITGYSPSGDDRPIWISPDWEKIAVLQTDGHTRNQLIINGVAGPWCSSINYRSVTWSPDSRDCAYVARLRGETLFLGSQQINDIVGNYRLAASYDGKRRAAFVFRNPARPGQLATSLLVVDGVEHPVSYTHCDGLRFARADSRLYLKIDGEWIDENGQATSGAVINELNAPPTFATPPSGVTSHPITTRKYSKSVGHPVIGLYVDGKLVGEYEHILSKSSPRGREFYHVRPDGTAIVYAVRGGHILRVEIQ